MNCQPEETPFQFYLRKHHEFIEDGRNPSSERIMAIQFGMQMSVQQAQQINVSALLTECVKQTVKAYCEEQEAREGGRI